MKKRVVPALWGVVALTALLSAPICSAEDFTARDGLAKAEEAADVWYADAVLTGVRTTSLKADGRAAVWQYDYFSAANSTCARILIVGQGDARLQDMGGCPAARPVPDMFVDSTEMLKAAVAAGFKPDKTSNAYLAMRRDRTAEGRACWVNFTSLGFDEENTAARGWCVDPETGKFTSRLSGSE